MSSRKMRIENYLKIALILLLVISIPIVMSSQVAALDSSKSSSSSDTEKPAGMKGPQEQCYDKVKKGEDFVEFMDNGVIRVLEAISSVLYALSTVINTIDFFVSLVGNFIGFDTPQSKCCKLLFPAGSGVCATNYAWYTKWKDFKSKYLGPIVNIATCACCSNPQTGLNALKAGALGTCPLGNLADMFSGLGNKEGANGQSAGGIGKYHLNAFDNIYVAVGCMCPVAILFNLRKLKSIYESHNCCVKQACIYGMPLEACERQFDEASCMYWEGAGIKAIITIIASIISGWIADMLTKLLVDQPVLAGILSCIMIVVDLTEIPAKVKAITGSFDWLKQTFKKPDCEDLRFDEIRESMEAGYNSETAGIDYMIADANRDGMYDTVAESNKQVGPAVSEKLPEVQKPTATTNPAAPVKPAATQPVKNSGTSKTATTKPCTGNSCPKEESK